MRRTFIGLMLFGVTSVGLGSQVVLTVQDTEGAPVPQAEVRIHFVLPQPQKSVVTMTDGKGRMKAEGRTLFGFEIDVRKPGYYAARLDHPPRERFERTVILPEKKNPIALFAREVGKGLNRDGDFPAENEWLGYDFEVGDWVVPHGRGRTTDIRLRFRHQFHGYRYTPKELAEEIRVSKEIAARDGVVWTEAMFNRRHARWSGEMELSFPDAGDGMIEVVDRYVPYSELTMPHQAPVDGYGPGRTYVSDNYEARGRGFRHDAGWFLRTRTRLDEQNNVISAHYTKVLQDFRFWVEGRVEFTYYFNPSPNDRNLEFDPERNLFPKSLQTMFIVRP